MKFRSRIVTLALLLSNLVLFAVCWYTLGSFKEPQWTQHLLLNGADFAPLTLDQQWYRIFTHLFLHGSFFHLAFNMYALFNIGSEVERVTGPIKFLWIYFLSGLIGSIASLYYNLFTIGVGASGAIFGLFGFYLVIQIAQTRKANLSVIPLVVNFAVFLGVNLLFAKMLNADNAAHLGGLVGGIILGVTTLLDSSSQRVRSEYLTLIVAVAAFLLLPRYQVSYFRFFQSVLAAEDSAKAIFEKIGVSDADYMQNFKTTGQYWDSARLLLDAHTYLPKALHKDTARLRKYIYWRKKENGFRTEMIENESYRYLDSLELSQEQIRAYLQLDYPLPQLRPIRERKADTLAKSHSKLYPVKVWYNDDWEEVPGPPAAFYRIGNRDSAGVWQGPVRDYFSSGRVQMKGFYTNGRKDGVFLYYSDHNTYESAGRYKKEIPVGKWERFHHNGKLESEEYFEPEYFLKNMWDSIGNRIVENGEGHVTLYHRSGILKERGIYRNGKKEGMWVGYHGTGQPYFEEIFANGNLLRGRSVTEDGQRFTYDASSMFPIPELGYANLDAYLKAKVTELNPATHGMVRVWFRVTPNRVLTDFQVDKSLSADLDRKALEFLRAGPTWLPARDHGHQMRSGWATVTILF